MNITKPEAEVIAKLIESQVTAQLSGMDFDQLCELITTYQKFATYSEYRVFPGGNDSEEIENLKLEVARLTDALAAEAKLTAHLKEELNETKIDTGKALALREANWAIAEIADEMGLTEKQVTNAIAREKAKRRKAARAS